MLSTIFTSILLASSVIAAPFEKRKLNEYTPNISIHESCNANQTLQLQKGLHDMMEITNVARNYVLANGPKDPLVQKYFGPKPAYVAILGAYGALQQSNKKGVLLRCDNPDDNCRLDGWAGHWRGENATLETVICPLSYEIRKPIEQVCGDGYTVAGSSPSYYFATDLMHRMYHIPTIADEKVSHFADTYAECLELALTSPMEAAYNTHTLQYFASDVWAQEIAMPGIGCTGESPVVTAPSASASASASYSVYSDIKGTATASAALSCHTHAGGELHCV